MRENTLRTKLANGETVANGWLHIPSGIAAEGMALAGFDSLTIDMQHGPVHYDTAVPMLQAISTTDTIPLARVPWNEPGIIMKMLDAGAYGIICPMINSREECEAFVGACRYPPLGYRSHGPTRVSMYAGNGYAEAANETVLTFAMIETAQAMENLEDILSVEGLDAIYVGPADLSRSLGGRPGADFEDGPVVEALDTIIEATKRHGIYAGLHNATAAYSRRMFDKGYQFATVQSDLGFLRSKAGEVAKAIKHGGAESGKGSLY